MLCYVPSPGFMWNPLENFPVNADCFCGSGKKFKKCHRPNLPRCISVADYQKLEPYIQHIYTGKLRVKQEKESQNEIQNTSVNQSSPVPVDDERISTEAIIHAGELPESGEPAEPVAHIPADLDSRGVESTNS